MALPNDKQSKKGSFSAVHLPVAKRYIYPRSRKLMFLIGGGGALAIAAAFVFNMTAQHGTLVSNGPLSSNHALFATDCAACHTPSEAVTDATCATCHEKYGDNIGIYTFASHYLYRSADFSRVAPSPDEVACSACHTEHLGRDAAITNVPDARCLTCHDFGSFNTRHPAFEPTDEALADEANLRFTHAHHIAEVKEREGVADIEQTCLYCHNPDDDGKNFQPLDFDRHCDACHLQAGVATPWLATTDDTPAGMPAVRTLETIRTQRSPGSRWADYTSPNEFQDRGGRVRKRPLYHEDPWILDNLRRLRQTLYPSSGLADLLKTSAHVDPQEAAVLYEEALATLRDYAEALRGEPHEGFQDELDEINRLIQQVAARLRDPYSPLDETRFAVSAAAQNPALTPDQVATYTTFIDDLTQPCRQCHLVENATLVRPQADQKTFTRAEFDHRAHIIHRRCLQCHTEIPIQRLAATQDANDVTANADLDNAGILNLPNIDTCQTCHTSDKAANTCTTCHLFHPDKSEHANLLLYRKEE